MTSPEHLSLPVGAAVPSLVRWGLSCDADLVFRTLTTMGGRDARTLAAELGLPARRVGDALAELRGAGVAAPGPGRARAPVWTAAPVRDAVAAVRRRRLRLVDEEAQARSHRTVVTELSRGAATVPAAGAVGGELGDGVRYLPDRPLTRARLADLMDAERSEHLAINTEQAFDAASARPAAPLSRRMVDRGVRMRVLGLPPADRDLHVDAALFGHARFGYREAAEMPLKLFVVDRRVALFPADPADFDRGYLEISQPGMVRALVMLFEQHWATATDPRESGLPEVVLTDRERELVTLLAQGHTDASAAARMRVSTRLITKIMRELMDRFGVENRFQLGLALGAARVTTPQERP
ncbi:helix-turn-helix transcriptional regulator [Catenuloplanes indicus]|uniref:DNA-binding CsgD family transcriptional regulator n=1 Tax=Catenuloplanes indicus TaxID=137267 RepID=A0AAE3VT17_9ACTN|nr:helix-turn-helix transcriptional regulator [Catenuloplanes indicus]MDQ0363748.1 DNA-binding CsgD family transcriptional regulator [Catenuloplanes indicus]